MHDDRLWHQIAEHIGTASGEPFVCASRSDLGGGCINVTTRLGDGRRDWLVKTNDSPTAAMMFAAEAAGLAALAATATVRVPRPLCTGSWAGHAYLVMEYIEFRHTRGTSQAAAGRQLAQLHRAPADRFGWQRDNTLGATHQPNTWSDDWIAFWRDRRLGFQLAEARRNGYTGRLQRSGERLCEGFSVLIDHAPRASLIHGDLWSGNIGFDTQARPVLFDPACYHADREAELAMTELFGGFSADFYAAYREAWPLDPGYRVRKTLYNLYHVLNHLNLFGGGYAGQAQAMIDRLLADCG